MAVEIGTLCAGHVTGMIDYGAFVDIGEGVSGMVHISEVANTYVTNIREHLTIGQQVRVKVLNITPEGKISLSIKKAVEASAEPAPAAAPRAPRRQNSAPNVWQGQRKEPGEPQNFEDMMSRFKQTSEDKISTLRRGGDTRYGGNPKRRK